MTAFYSKPPVAPTTENVVPAPTSDTVTPTTSQLEIRRLLDELQNEKLKLAEERGRWNEERARWDVERATLVGDLEEVISNCTKITKIMSKYK